MRATASLLLRLVCSLALLFSALPTRAGVVCVERGRVVGVCPMASIPETAAQTVAEKPPAMAKAACCRAEASKLRATIESAAACPTHPKTRCAYAYRSGPFAVATAKAKGVDVPPLPEVAVMPDAFVEISFEILVGAGGGTFAGDSDPPRSRPRAPDRGRAPPVA